MEPEQAWTVVKTELKQILQKADYVTWVENLQFINCSRKGTFTVSVANRYTKEWVEKNLLFEIEEALSKIIDKKTTLKLVLEQDNLDDDADDDTVWIEGVYDNGYEATVQPEKVVVIPAYFGRHVRRIGPFLSFLYVGFRQALYFSGSSSYVRATANTICRFSGCKRTAFWERMGQEETWKVMSGFITQVNQKPEWEREKGKNGSPKRKPKKYKVNQQIPLTPGDARSLRSWLINKSEETNSINDAIEEALNTPNETLIPIGVNWEHDYQEPTITVGQLIFDLGGTKEQAEKMQAHIMPPKDVIVFTHYFLEYWVPKLGAERSWLVTFLRDECFSSEKEQRNVAIASINELCCWIGIKREKTIREWLLDPDTRKFISPIEEGGSRGPNAPRKWKVTLEEPLIGRETVSVLSALGERISAHRQENFDSRERQNKVENGIGEEGQSGVLYDCNDKDSGDAYNTESILSENNANPKIVKLLVSKKNPSTLLVAWILYGISNANINDPLALAISKVTEDATVSPGAPYEYLAALAPSTLQSQIQDFIRNGSSKFSSDQTWKNFSSRLKSERLIQLANILLMKIDDNPWGAYVQS
ncbi:MAG: DnaA N-terminal domain-containing protein [Bacteroidales bacterium]